MNRKSNYRDPKKFRETRNAQKRRYYGKTKDVPNKGKRWSEDDIAVIMVHEKTDTEISALIGRSVGAIQSRRSLIKKLQNG